jgi:hypothetical protein
MGSLITNGPDQDSQFRQSGPITVIPRVLPMNSEDRQQIKADARLVARFVNWLIQQPDYRRAVLERHLGSTTLPRKKLRELLEK